MEYAIDLNKIHNLEINLNHNREERRLASYSKEPQHHHQEKSQWLDTLIYRFRIEEKKEKDETLDLLFKRYNEYLETQKSNNDFVFFQLDYEILKDFYYTFKHISLIERESILQFNKEGLIVTNNKNNTNSLVEKVGEQEVVNKIKEISFRLFFNHSFFQYYSIEDGLELETEINISSFLLLLDSFMKKDSCDVLYFLISNSCITLCAIKRNETRERKCTYIKSKKVDKKFHVYSSIDIKKKKKKNK